MMERAAVLAYLERQGIQYELVLHRPVYTSAEGKALNLPKAERVAKNLFLRDDKRQSYYLVSVQQDKRVDLKQLRRTLGSRPLSLASEQELLELLGLPKGWVTPLGVLNDSQCQVQVLVDNYFAGGEIGVHPNDNSATIWLATEALVQLLRRRGNKVNLVEL